MPRKIGHESAKEAFGVGDVLVSLRKCAGLQSGTAHFKNAECGQGAPGRSLYPNQKLNAPTKFKTVPRIKPIIDPVFWPTRGAQIKPIKKVDRPIQSAIVKTFYVSRLKQHFNTAFPCDGAQYTKPEGDMKRRQAVSTKYQRGSRNAKNAYCAANYIKNTHINRE